MATLADIQQDATKLTGSQFVQRLGPVVLLQYPGDGSSMPDDQLRTVVSKGDRDTKSVTYRLLVANVVSFVPSSRSWILKVGRDERNDLVLEDGSVSKEHAVVEHHDGRTEVTDLGSTNGTTLNGTALAARSPGILTEGSLIGFGDVRYAFYSAARLYLLLSGG